MSTRITVDQLEQMKTHELADLLSNVVLLLRRMPNVECSQLVRQDTDDASLFQAQPQQRPLSDNVTLTQAELKKKKVEDLKKIADDLHLPVTSKIKKDELIAKILSRAANGHSEQFTIQNL